jgi:shikimate dehydrogenase
MKIDSRTKLYGLLGFPVKHSFSPFMHNAAFAALDINAVYLSFSTSPDRLKEAINAIRALEIKGLNVTIPFKERVIPLLDGVDKEAQRIKAVNTIKNEAGRLIGYNTDGRGFVSSLRQGLRVSARGKRILILGAGGAARAVAFALAKDGAASIAIFDIIKRRAKRVSGDIQKSFPRCRTLALDAIFPSWMQERGGIDILINATPVGMKPSDPALIELKNLPFKPVVCDLIYNPPRTKLILAAQKIGLKNMNGLGMLLHQGALSFEIWTGKEAPLGVMKKALEDFMGKNR